MLLALYIIQSTFKLISSSAFHQPALNSFFEQVIKPNLQSTVSTLRCEAVKGLVLLGIMNRVSLPLSFSRPGNFPSVRFSSSLHGSRRGRNARSPVCGDEWTHRHSHHARRAATERKPGIRTRDFDRRVRAGSQSVHFPLQRSVAERGVRMLLQALHFRQDPIDFVSLEPASLVCFLIFLFIEGFSTRRRIDSSSIKSSPCSFPPSAVPKSTATVCFLKRPWSLR